MTPEELDLKTVFDLWMDSPLKVQIVSFYHQNPGIIETVEGLARRMGSDPEVMRRIVADHVKIGFLRQRSLGSAKVLLFDRQGEQKLQEYVSRSVRERRNGAKSP